MKSKGGFTLIEIMVVVVILGILASLAIPSVMGRAEEARMVAAKQDVKSIWQGLKLYNLDNGVYPDVTQGLNALVSKPEIEPIPKNWRKGGYLEALPKDPWGNRYQYLNPGHHREVDVFSYGADGQPGGEEADADIGSWAD